MGNDNYHLSALLLWLLSFLILLSITLFGMSRNVAFGYIIMLELFVAEVNEAAMDEDLNKSWFLPAEPIQMVYLSPGLHIIFHVY